MSQTTLTTPTLPTQGQAQWQLDRANERLAVSSPDFRLELASADSRLAVVITRRGRAVASVVLGSTGRIQRHWQGRAPLFGQATLLELMAALTALGTSTALCSEWSLPARCWDAERAA